MIEPEVIVPEMQRTTIETLKLLYGACSGTGIFEDKNVRGGQLTFSFSAQGDSTYMQFKDLLGRKVLIVNLFDSSLYLWDILKNKVYNTSDVSSRINFLNMITVSDFNGLIWGIQPSILELKGLDEFRFDGDSTVISFKSDYDNGFNEINEVSYFPQGQDYSVRIIFNDRIFGEINPQVQQLIPKAKLKL